MLTSKSILLFALITGIHFIGWAGTKNKTVHQVVTSKAAVVAPSIFMTYGYYHYDLQGTNNANTEIYGFDKSTVDLHMLTATWLINPQWTLLTFIPYIKNMVQTVYFPGTSMTAKTTDYTEGLGDVRFMAMTPMVFNGNHLLMGDLGFTAPTGSIDETFTSNSKQRAAYNMQLGSGTPDFIAGSTYSYSLGAWVHSTRGQATVRGGRNANGWALGNEFLANASSKYRFGKYIEAGVAGSYKVRDKVQGRDELYEKFNNIPGYGDGHQYYHYDQSTWDTQVVAKLSAPPVGGVTAILEGGVIFYRDSLNEDDIRLDMPYWVSASVTGAF